MATTTLLLVAALSLRAVQGTVEGLAHVTRLHRYDHSGLEAMLEIEAQWQRDVPGLEDRSTGRIGDVAPHRALRSGVGARHGPAVPASSFVQMSTKQVTALRDHHRDVARETAGSVGNETASPLNSGALAQKLHDYAMAKPGLHAGHAVTGLSSIGSQYVGQVGVGTMVKPDNCVVDPAKELAYVGEEKASALLQMNSTACHLADESHALMVFDTGSTNIWVPDVNCKGACAKPERNRYDSKMSTTFHSPDSMIQLAVQFGTGKVEGTQAIDTLHLGEGLSVRDQTFGRIQSETGAVFENSPFDGIWGLAFPAMSANGVVPSFDNIIKQKVLKDNQFSFYMHPTNPSANAIFWGVHDPTLQSEPFAFHKVVKPFYWSLKMNNFKIGSEVFLGRDPAAPAALLEQGQASADEAYYAIVDTGTTFCTAETGVYEKIMARIPAVKCNARTETSHPPISWNMDAVDGKLKDYTMTNQEYMTSDGKGADAMCTPAFMRIDIPAEHRGLGAMVWGEVFMRKYTTQYQRGPTGDPDDARVGIALAVHDDNAVNTIKSHTQGQGFSKSIVARLTSKEIPVPPTVQTAPIPVSKPL